MAISEGSPFGKLKGRLGSAVGFNWKGKNAVRSYAVPANPQTPAQQAQRLMMSNLVIISRTILATILQKFWDPFAKGMSGYNAFVKANLDTMYPLWEAAKLIFAQGSLELSNITSAVLNTATHVLTISWSPTCTSNGLATDSVVAIAYDISNGMCYVVDYDGERADGSIELDLPASLTLPHCLAYLFFYRVEDTKVSMVSPTSYSVCTAP